MHSEQNNKKIFFFMEGSVLCPEMLTAKLYIGSVQLYSISETLFLKIHIYTTLLCRPTPTKLSVYLRCVWYNFCMEFSAFSCLVQSVPSAAPLHNRASNFR